MTKNATLSAAAVLGADFTWTFGEDASPATSSKHGNMSSDAITYAGSGVKTATLDFVYNGSKTTMQCAPLQVNGAAITGCKCTYAAEEVDVSVDGTAAWTVTGCTSQGANITTYTWGGDGVTGDGTAATAVLTEKGQEVAPTLLVGNDDNTQQAVTCPTVTAIDARAPDYEIAKANDEVTVAAGKTSITMGGTSPQGCQFYCKQAEGSAVTVTLGGTKTTCSSGCYHFNVTATTANCAGVQSFETTAEVTCGANWW
jgi:hypothetical protein